MTKPIWKHSIGLCLFALTGACTGSIGSGLDGDAPWAPAGGSSANAEGAGGNGDGGGPNDPLLEPEHSPPVSGMRRLTSTEYDSTLWDLIEDDSRSSALLLPEDPRNPFDNDYTNQIASQALIEGAELLAADATERLMNDTERRDRVVGCAPTEPEDTECLRSFVTTFGRRALRRPLTDAEVEAYMSAKDFATDDGDFYSAVDIVIRAMLQDPNFLYRVEVGEPLPDHPGLYQLSQWELASRLSYFLWGSMPDDELLDRAAAGQLALAADVREVAKNMMNDPRARARLDRFHALWLGFETISTPNFAAAMQTETRALLERVIFEEKRPWQDIFRSDETFVSDALAEHYGLEPPGSTEPVWTSYGDSGRQGILSHGSFLSNGAKFDDTSPTLRGLAIRTRLFCQEMAPPPPNVNVDDPIPSTEEAVCKVDRYAQHRQGGCATCHDLMDPIGFGLENYDQQGRFRAVEADHPECAIEGTGSLKDVGSFSGPAELADLMLDSGLLNHCAVTQLYRFAMGRYVLDEIDADFVNQLTDEVGSGDFRLDDLIANFVSSDRFRIRREEEIEE